MCAVCSWIIKMARAKAIGESKYIVLNTLKILNWSGFSLDLNCSTVSTSRKQRLAVFTWRCSDVYNNKRYFTAFQDSNVNCTVQGTVNKVLYTRYCTQGTVRKVLYSRRCIHTKKSHKRETTQPLAWGVRTLAPIKKIFVKSIKNSSDQNKIFGRKVIGQQNLVLFVDLTDTLGK